MCKIAEWVANSVDPDQTPRSVASDLGLYCLLKLYVWIRRVCTTIWLNRHPHPPPPSEIILDPPLFRVDANRKYPNQQAVVYIHIRNFAIFVMFYSTQWFYKRTVKVLIRLHGCAHWSWPSLSAYARRHVFAWRGPNSPFHRFCE